MLVRTYSRCISGFALYTQENAVGNLFDASTHDRWRALPLAERTLYLEKAVLRTPGIRSPLELFKRAGFSSFVWPFLPVEERLKWVRLAHMLSVQASLNAQSWKRSRLGVRSAYWLYFMHQRQLRSEGKVTEPLRPWSSLSREEQLPYEMEIDRRRLKLMSKLSVFVMGFTAAHPGASVQAATKAWKLLPPTERARYSPTSPQALEVVHLVRSVQRRRNRPQVVAAKRAAELEKQLASDPDAGTVLKSAKQYPLHLRPRKAMAASASERDWRASAALVLGGDGNKEHDRSGGGGVGEGASSFGVPLVKRVVRAPRRVGFKPAPTPKKKLVKKEGARVRRKLDRAEERLSALATGRVELTQQAQGGEEAAEERSAPASPAPMSQKEVAAFFGPL